MDQEAAGTAQAVLRITLEDRPAAAPTLPRWLKVEAALNLTMNLATLAVVAWSAWHYFAR